MKKTEAIKAFLDTYTWPDLAELYNYSMEVQVNVLRGTGDPIEGEYRGKFWRGYTDGVQVWKSFRIPYNASSNPEYTDVDVQFNMVEYTESIGMTGWDWEHKLSRWVAYDFDAIVGQNTDGKLSGEELEKVQENALQLPYVTVRRSTGGSGLHLYVFLDPVPTSNHNEHAALGRAILLHMSAECGFDFNGRVDVCGGNMWVYHRKMEGVNGLELIKSGDRLNHLPDNWRAHLDVVENRRNKATITLGDSQGDFELLAEQRNRIDIDSEHKAIIEELKKEPFETYYNPEQGCIVTHTKALKDVHERLSLKGVFETNTTCSTTKNCFCFLLPKGGLHIFRFGSNVMEHKSWQRDLNGWTHCYYNKAPSIRAAVGVFGGVENPKKGYDFRTAEIAQKVLESIGSKIELPEVVKKRSTTIKELPGSKILVEIDAKGLEEDVPMEDWGLKGKTWHRIFEREPTETYSQEYDSMVRLLVSEDNSEVCWTYFSSADWMIYNRETIRSALSSKGYSNQEITDILGICADAPWKLVHRPFEPEYPGNRCWNRNAPQLAYTLKTSRDNLSFPTWTGILNHVGSGLDYAVANDLWCNSNGIYTGGDFLKVWCALMFQRPELRLPYLFFYSPEQQTGKSTFHEALGSLMRRGYVKADLALKNQFNGELAHSVLCVIEETDLGKEPGAYNKVKEWTTGREINVRELYKSPVHIRNTTHWVQAANRLDYLPIEPNDTRIIVCLVRPLAKIVNTMELRERLKAEAQDFLTEVMTLELPTPYGGRMAMPVLMTNEKSRAERNKESDLDRFLREDVYYCMGAMVLVQEFYDRFIESLEPGEKAFWTKSKCLRELPEERFPKGRRKNDGRVCVGNISFTKQSHQQDKPLVNVGGKLK